MSSLQSADDSTGSVESTGTLSSAVDTVRNSALLVMAVLGVLFVVVGYAIQSGVWAGMLAVWGVALVFVGVAGYALIWWRRR